MRPFKKIHDKKLRFFTVVEASAPANLLTIVLTKGEALEYAETRIYVEHQEHFQSWCALRNYDAEDADAWTEYLTVLIENDALEDNYLIMPVTYYYDNIASILRMFGGCAPIGCSFDTAAEKIYWNASLGSEHMNKVLEILKEELIKKDTEENTDECKSR